MIGGKAENTLHVHIKNKLEEQKDIQTGHYQERMDDVFSATSMFKVGIFNLKCRKCLYNVNAK